MTMTATTRERPIPHDQGLTVEQNAPWIGHRRRPRPSGAALGSSPSGLPGDGRPPPRAEPAPVAELTPLEQDPALLCANLALCVVEILAGARSLDQIGRWVTDAVFVNLLRRTVIVSRSRAVSDQDAMRPRFRVGTPRLSQLADGSIEAVVVVHQPSRSRAIAIRLERHRHRWRATVLSVL